MIEKLHSVIENCARMLSYLCVMCSLHGARKQRRRTMKKLCLGEAWKELSGKERTAWLAGQVKTCKIPFDIGRDVEEGSSLARRENWAGWGTEELQVRSGAMRGEDGVWWSASREMWVEITQEWGRRRCPPNCVSPLQDAVFPLVSGMWWSRKQHPGTLVTLPSVEDLGYLWTPREWHAKILT